MLVPQRDTPEPGVTPLKWKLKYPEQPNSDICNQRLSVAWAGG